MQHLDDVARGGEGLHPVHLAPEQQGGDGHQKAEQHQHQIGRALEDQAHFKARAGDELADGLCKAVTATGQRAGLRRVDDGFFLGLLQFGLFLFRIPAGGAAEEGDRGSQEGKADAGPQQAVTQQDAGQFGKLGILLGGRPVAGNLAKGTNAQRFQPAAQFAHFRLGQKGGSDHEIEDDQADSTDIAGHHRTGQGGEAKDYRRGEEYTG